MKLIERVIEYGLYLLVFLLPLQTRLIVKQGYLNGWPNEFSTISIYAIDILLIALLILQTVRYFATLKRDDTAEIKLPRYWWALAVFELITFISIFVASDKAIAIYNYLHLLLAIGVFWLIISTQYKKEKLILVFIASSIIQALLGAWQFLAQSTFANKWLGLATHPIQEAGTAVVINGTGERILRAYGTLDHPNIFGGLMVIALLLLLAYFVKPFLTSPPSASQAIALRAGQPSPCLPDRQASEGEGAQARTVNIVLYYSSLIILTCGLFFSFSRAAWISFFVSYIFLFSLALIKKDKAYLKLLLSSATVLLLVVSALIFKYNDLVLNRMSEKVYTESKSINERMEGNKLSNEIIKDNWLLGVGVGSYGATIKNRYSNLDYQLYQPVHNVYLLVVSELGIFGLISLILFIILVISTINRAENKYLTVLPVSIVLLFFFDHWLLSLHYGIILFFVVLSSSIKKE